MQNRLFMLMTVAAVPFSLAHASFCTTYVADGGQGVCVNGTAAAGSQNGTSNPLSASVVFEVSNGNLNVTLVNDLSSGITHQLGGGDVLTAMLFNLTNTSGNSANLAPNTIGFTPSLTTTPSDPLGTSTLTTSPGTCNGSPCTLADEWAYVSSTDHTANGNHQYNNTYEDAISSTGLISPAGQNANWNCGSNCNGLDGPPWGIVPSAAAIGSNGIAPGINPLVQNFAYFTLSGLTGSGLTNANLASHLSDIVFQYGTSFGSEPDINCSSCTYQISSVPEPGYLVLLVGGLIALICFRRSSITARNEPN